MEQDPSCRPARVPRSFDLLRSPESPISMFMRKGEKGQPVSWSALKFVVIGSWAMFWVLEVVVLVLNRPSPWNEWSVKALASILVTLVLETVAALIPFPQLLHAIEKGVTGASQIVANKASEIKDRVVSTLEHVRSGTDVAAPAAAPAAAADPPHEWAEGDPHAGLG